MAEQYYYKKGKSLESIRKKLGFCYGLAPLKHSDSLYEAGIDMNPRTIDDVDVFINECINEGAKKVILSEIDQKTFDYIIKSIRETVEILHIKKFYNPYDDQKGTSYDLKFLALCKNLKEVHIDLYNGTLNLWELNGNQNLEELYICGCKKLVNQDGLRNCKAKTLRIVRAIGGIPDTKDLVIDDFSVFNTMENLENLDLFTGKKKDKKDDLLSLANLKNIKEIKLTKNYFTFKQFAWLSSKLPGVKGIGCIHKWKYDKRIEADTYTINGTRMAWEFKDRTGKEIEKYLRKFDKLVEEYKNQDIPPID